MHRSPDDRRILVKHLSVGSEKVKSLELTTGKELFERPLNPELPQLVALQWSPDSQSIAASFALLRHFDQIEGSGPFEEHLQIWDASSGEVLFTARSFLTARNASHVRQLSWSPDSKLVAISDYTSRLRVFDVAVPTRGKQAPTDKLDKAATALPPSVGSKPKESTGRDIKDLEKQLHQERTARLQLECLADVLRAEEAWREDNIERVRSLMDKHSPLPGQPDNRGREWHDLHALYHRHLFALKPVGDGDGGLHWSPNGKWLASAGRKARADGTGGTLNNQIWNASTGKEVDFGVSDGLEHPNWSPDNQWLASVGQSGIMLVDVAKKGKGRLLENTYVTQPLWSPTSRLLAGRDRAGYVDIWDVATAKKNLKLGPAARTQAMAWSPNGQSIAAAGGDGLTAWDISSGKELYHFPFKGKPANRLAWSPNGKWLGVARVSDVMVLEASNGREVRSFPGPAFSGLAWSPDSQLLQGVVAGTSGPIWDVASGKERTELWKGFPGFPYIHSLHWSPDGRRLLFANLTGAPEKATVIDLASAKELFARNFKGVSPALRLVSWSPDSKSIAAVFATPDYGSERNKALEEQIQIWDGTTGEVLLRLRGAVRKGRDVYRLTRHLAWSPDSKLLAIGTPPINIYDVSSLIRGEVPRKDK